MKKNIRPIVIYIIVAVLTITICVGLNLYKQEKITNTMRETLHEYFLNSNSHISARGFSISNVKIRCTGNNAYIVDFNLVLNDKSSTFNRLGATIYKENDKWNVKGFGEGLSAMELRLYNFKCYN